MAILARPPRDVRLDIAKGILQLSIFAKHIGFSFAGGWVIHSAWGFSDSSELFVMFSGFALGSVFTLKAARGGWPAAARDLLGRTVRLYRTHLLVFALFGLMVATACHTIPPGESDRLGWTRALTAPLEVLPAILLMLHQPSFMGILPTFIWGMLLLPGFAWLWGRVGDWAILAPIGLYLLVQLTGLRVPGVEFDPLAWQVLFLGGAWLGRRALLHGRALALPPLWDRALTAAAIALLLAGVVLRLGQYGALPLDVPEYGPSWLADKPGLPPAALLHALALAWVVARFVPREAPWMSGGFAAWLAVIGRHSLEVFCLGLFVAWGATQLLALAPGHLGVDAAVTIGGALLLGLWARWLDRRGKRRDGVATEAAALRT